MRPYPLYLLVALLLLHAAIGAQQPVPAQQATTASPQVTFRTEIDFVEVHAVVTDRQGAFVRDLTADDFEIFEDGRLQKPSTFALVDLPIEPRRVPAGSPQPVEPDVRATSRTFDGRIYVFLLDDLHTDVRRSLSVRTAAREFVTRYLGADDLAAVVYTSGRQESGQELTSSHRLLLAAIDRFQGQKLPSAGAERMAVHLRENSDAEALADSAQPIRTNDGLQRAQMVRDPEDPKRAADARRALQAVEDVSLWLREVQGRRKALLFFSEGIDYDIYQPFNLAPSGSDIVAETQEAMAAAQRANVNVYGIDPRGLGQFSGLTDISANSDYPQLEYGSFRAALRELRLSQESLLALSDETGGLAVVNAGDVVGGLGRVVLDNSRYYLLGYHSDSTQWSRRFMKIDVRVKRPGTTVRARRGFLPPDSKTSSSRRDLEIKSATSPALKAALSRPVPIGELPVRVFAAPFRASSGSNGSVLLAVEIDGAALRFEERDGRFNEKIEVAIIAADERSRVQGEDRQEFDLRLQPQTYERVRRTGVRMLSRLTLPPGRYQIHVGAVERTGGAMGTVPYDLELPDYRRTPFGLSGLVVSSSADQLATANADPLLKDVLPGAPVAARTFSAADALTVYAEAYDAASQSHVVTFAATIRRASDGSKVFESSDRRTTERGGQPQIFRAEIPLKNVPPGMYVLALEATSALGPTARRDVPFEVTP